MTKTAPEKEVSFSSMTPSGIEVKYQAEPRRAYWVRRDSYIYSGLEIPGTDWVEVPSVTTVLGVLDKPALPYWGMKIGIEGVATLIGLGALLQHPHERKLLHIDGTEATVETVVDLLTQYKLTVNHVRDKAGDRGTTVHDAFETWARHGLLPDPMDFTFEHHGYIAGLRKFLDQVKPEPLEAEVMVGSIEHGFAGRYDVRFRVPEEVPVIVHSTPKRGPQWKLLPKGLYLGDLKTSKGVYPTHAKQLEAYELASVECGYDPTDYRGILRVGADGSYQFVRSWATGKDFLSTLGEWKSQQEMEARRKAS